MEETFELLVENLKTMHTQMQPVYDSRPITGKRIIIERKGGIMMEFNKEELEKAIILLSSTITKCEKMQLKFSERTSQHSLLKNRIKALNISRELLTGDKTKNFTIEELGDALPPVVSIINKTTKAQSKYEHGSSQFNRLEPIIQAMLISKSFIEGEINRLSIITLK